MPRQFQTEAWVLGGVGFTSNLSGTNGGPAGFVLSGSTCAVAP
jgi:hypothetical protein